MQETVGHDHANPKGGSRRYTYQQSEYRNTNAPTNLPPLGRYAAGDPETVWPQRGRAPVTGVRERVRSGIRAGLDAKTARNYCLRVESKR